MSSRVQEKFLFLKVITLFTIEILKITLRETLL